MRSKKKLLLKISQYSQKNTCVILFLIKLQVFRPLTTDVSCEYREIFKYIYFEEILRTVASVHKTGAAMIPANIYTSA